MLRNVGIWNAVDATELHELISSPPLAPWISAEVTALAEHPVERALRERGDAQQHSDTERLHTERFPEAGEEER